MKHIFEIKMLFSFNIQIPKHYFFQNVFCGMEIHFQSYSIYLFKYVSIFIYFQMIKGPKNGICRNTISLHIYTIGVNMFWNIYLAILVYSEIYLFVC